MKIEYNTFENLPELNLLNLSYNQITALPRNVFKPLVALLILQLQGNQIQTIYSDLFLHNEYLFSLDLSNNSLINIQPKSFRNNLNLQHLFFDGNRNLSSIDLFPENRNIITILQLSYCGFIQLYIPKNVFIIDVQFNKINSITAHRETVLWKLEISDNNLTDFAYIPPMNNLVYLNMVRNAIELINFSNVSHFEKLRRLAISLNPRQNISAASIKIHFPKLLKLYIISPDMSIEQQKRILYNLKYVFVEFI